MEDLTKKTQKNETKLRILKDEVNKSQNNFVEIMKKNKDKDSWCDEITKLKEQNDFLVASNYKNRAELKNE